MFLAIAIWALASFSLCAQVQIKGTLSPKGNYTEVSLMRIDQEVPMQTAPIDANGNFEFKLDVTVANYYRLVFDETLMSYLIISPNEKIQITISPDKPDRPVITGSTESLKLYTVNQRLAQFSAKEEEILSQYEANNSQRKKYIAEQIRKEPAALSNFFFLDFLDFQVDNDLIELMVSKLYGKYPENQFVKELYQQLETYKTAQSENTGIEIGAIAPDIELPNPKGEIIALSSFRGKVVLIDFWASWCKPCRIESPNMVKLYEKYKDKGFEIYSISLDKKREDWLDAIAKDGLKWTHVSDLKFWQSIAAQTYKVEGIPYTVLIDTKGKIVATDLRGAELEAKVAEMLNK